MRIQGEKSSSQTRNNHHASVASKSDEPVDSEFGVREIGKLVTRANASHECRVKN
jgi:hypothetical protein